MFPHSLPSASLGADVPVLSWVTLLVASRRVPSRSPPGTLTEGRQESCPGAAAPAFAPDPLLSHMQASANACVSMTPRPLRLSDKPGATPEPFREGAILQPQTGNRLAIAN